MQQPVDLIVNAQWILTVDAQARKLKDQALIIKDQKILAIEPINQHSYQAKTTLERREHILMPGLINAHTHAAMSLLRGLADDLPLMTWLNEHIWPAESRWVSERFVQDGVELAIAEMIRGGTTCFNDMYFFPNISARVAREAKMRACFAFPIFEFPSAWGQSADDYLHKGLQLLDDYRHHELINLSFGPHAPYTVADESFKRIAAITGETQTGVHIHLHETKQELAEAQAQYHQRPIDRLAKFGLLSPQLQAVHMTQLSDTEIATIAAEGVQVIHCPESNLKLASGFCPVAKLLDVGVNVALGTDGAASNNDLDMFAEMRTAALIAKAVAEDSSAVPADTALQMATLNGAKALGLDKTTGSLEIGKAADFIAVSIQEAASTPCYDPASLIVYAGNSQFVTDTWIAGQQLLRDRQLTTLNLDAVIKRANNWQQQIQTADLKTTH